MTNIVMLMTHPPQLRSLSGCRCIPQARNRVSVPVQSSRAAIGGAALRAAGHTPKSVPQRVSIIAHAADKPEPAEEPSTSRPLSADGRRESSPSSPVNSNGVPSTGGPAAEGGAADDTDAVMRNLFEATKKDLVNTLGLPPAASQYLKDLTYDEMMVEPQAFMNKVAEEFLGPVMSSIGVEQSAFSFLVELLQIGLLLQLISVGSLFYATELLLHYDTGTAFRCAAALQLGYFMRPFLSVERIMWPIYEDLLRLLLNDPEASYGAPPITSGEMQKTVNSIGLWVGAAFLLPQFVLGWSTRESLQLVVPLGVGWFMCDVWLIIALLIKLEMK